MVALFTCVQDAELIMRDRSGSVGAQHLKHMQGGCTFHVCVQNAFRVYKMQGGCIFYVCIRGYVRRVDYERPVLLEAAVCCVMLDE